MHALPRGLEDRAHERDGRALAVGAGKLANHRRQAPFRLAERGEEALDAAEREIDAFRVQRQQSREDGLPALLPGLGQRRAGPEPPPPPSALTPAPAG